MPRCPDCDGDLLLGAEVPDAGEIVICPECGVELAVVSTDPVELRVIPEEPDGDTAGSDGRC